MDGAVEVVAERHPDAYGFLLKATGTGLIYRVTPARDPRQPRFWCVVVFRCSAVGLPDSSERPWVGPGGLRREELKAALEAIRVDPGAWLAEAPHRELREWMLGPAAAPARPLPSTRAG